MAKITIARCPKWPHVDVTVIQGKDFIKSTMNDSWRRRMVTTTSRKMTSIIIIRYEITTIGLSPVDLTQDASKMRFFEIRFPDRNNLLFKVCDIYNQLVLNSIIRDSLLWERGVS